MGGYPLRGSSILLALSSILSNQYLDEACAILIVVYVSCGLFKL